MDDEESKSESERETEKKTIYTHTHTHAYIETDSIQNMSIKHCDKYLCRNVYFVLNPWLVRAFSLHTIRYIYFNSVC